MRPLFLGLLLTVGTFTCVAAEESRPIFTDEEKAKILGHSPWPPNINSDPSNRFSGDADAIAYGKVLFEEMTLSKDAILSCASCHQPDRHFMDGVPLNRGHELLDRHTPSLINVGQQRWFGWDGANDSLWAQSIRPILTASEMNLTSAEVKAVIGNDPLLSCGFERVFKHPPKDVNEQDLLVFLGKALAAYQETLISGPTPFDKFAAALAAEDMEAMAEYPESAKHGLKLFVGDGNCGLCHFGPNFTNGEFGNIGISYFIGKGKVDTGRHGGIKSLLGNPFNLLEPYNDDEGGSGKLRTAHVKQQYRNWGEFKIPSLRNVAETAPYMHNGSLATLEDVVGHYSELNEERLHTDGEKILRPLNLSHQEKNHLITFLRTLSAPLLETEIQGQILDQCKP